MSIGDAYRIRALIPERSGEWLRRLGAPLARLTDASGGGIRVAFVSRAEELLGPPLPDALLIAGSADDGVMDAVMRARRKGTRVVFDALVPPRLASLRSQSLPTGSVRPFLELVLSNVDAVTCPSNRCREELRAFNESCVVLPNLVDEHVFCESIGAESAENTGTVLVFRPCDGGSNDMDTVWNPVRRLTNRSGSNFSLMHFFGVPLPTIPPFRQMVLSPPPYPRLPALLSRAHVALAPGCAGPMAEFASDADILEYAALRIPVVAAKIPSYEDVAKEAPQLALADDESEWVRAVNKLSENPDSRRRLGESLRDWVFGNRTIGGRLSELASVLGAPNPPLEKIA